MSIAEQTLFIGGQWVSSERGITYETLDPFAGHVATRAAAATTVDVDRAVSAAQDAFAGWAALPPGKRRHDMLAVAEAVGLTPAMRAYPEKSFGRMATVVIVDGPKEALRVADDNAYGLSSAIFSRDVTPALDIAKRLNAGMSHQRHDAG